MPLDHDPVRLALLSDKAIHWAEARIGDADYQFECLGFVEDAYEQSNDLEMFGGDSAAESAAQYAPLNPGEPPRGAFAFYRCEGELDGRYQDWGHVGLATGSGRIIHTWDRIRADHYLQVERLDNAPGWTRPAYLGWVAPQRFLQGSKPGRPGT